MVTTVACDSGGKGTCAGSEVHDLGTVEDDYFLVFVGRKRGRGGRGSFVGFAFVVLFAEGSFALLLTMPTRRESGIKV